MTELKGVNENGLVHRFLGCREFDYCFYLSQHLFDQFPSLKNPPGEHRQAPGSETNVGNSGSPPVGLEYGVSVEVRTGNRGYAESILATWT